MKKLLVLFTLTAAVTVSTVFAAEPSTPASVSDPATLIQSGQNEQVARLQVAHKRLSDAKATVAKATQTKAVANSEVTRLQDELKTAQANLATLQKYASEQLTEQVSKLQAAADKEQDARDKLKAAKETVPTPSALVLGRGAKKLDQATAMLVEARKAFAAFVREVNGKAGTAIAENLDPVAADVKFAEAAELLTQKVTELSGKVAEAQGKANAAGNALATATAERTAAGLEVDRLTGVVTPQVVLQEVQSAATRPVVLSGPVTTQIGDTATAVREITTLKQQVSDLQTQIGGDQGLIKKVETLQTAIGALKIPTAEEIAGKIKVPTAEEIAAKITLPATLKLDAEQLKLVQDSLATLQTAMTDLQGRPVPVDTSAGTRRIEAALTDLQTKIGTTVYEEDAGTDQCGRRWVHYYIVKDGKKYHLYNYPGNK